MATDVLPPNAVVENGHPYDRSERSKAMPKHSLFGAELENFSKDEQQEIKEIDLKRFQDDQKQERLVVQTRYKSKLPSYLKSTMPGIQIEEKKQELERQLNETSQVTKTLNTIEEKSKYFQLGIINPQSQRFHSSPPKYSSMNENDRSHFNTVNQVGAQSAKRAGYDNKQQPVALPPHQYPLIGNPRTFGMEFDDTKQHCQSQMRPQYKRHHAPDWLPKEAFMHKPRSEPNPHIPVDLPPNIQHHFGTKICQDVLKDKYKVDETLSMQAKIRDSFNKTRKNEKEQSMEFVTGDPEYESLSQVVRQNIFPGYTQNHKKSLMKSVYTRDVFQKRVPDPDQWRCQRDELSTWAEQNVIRERTKKAWDIYQQAKQDGN